MKIIVDYSKNKNNACIAIKRSNNWQNADYECGYKCKFKDGINICKET